MNQATQEPWIPSVGYGVTQAGNTWGESENVHASALYLDANFEEAFKIDDVYSVFHYEPIAKLVRRSSQMTGENNDECKVINGLLCEDEIASLPLDVYLPKLSEDNIVGVDFSKRVPDLDLEFCDEFSVGNSRSAIDSPDASNDVVGASVSIPLPKRSSMLDTVEDNCRDKVLIEDGFRVKCSEDRDAKYPIIFGIQNSHKANDEHSIQSDEINQVNHCMEAEDCSKKYLSINSLSEGKVVRSREKRLYRPPNKYVEESPMSKSRRGRPRKCITSSTKEKDLEVISQTKCLGSSSQRTAAKCRRNLDSDSDDDYIPTESLGNRREQNNMWTLDEVVKLVDGVAHFGQGQWTAIQKTFFTSSCRTPTDIRDKWRNLVNTYCGNPRQKRKTKVQVLKKGTLSLPNLVIERVRELAN